MELKALAWCVAIGLLLLWLSLSTGCGQPAEAATAPEPRPVAYVDLTPTTAAYDRVFPGVVETSEHTTLGFEVPGTIAEVHFDVGERFEAGDTLAVLEARPFQIERRRRLANLAGARATLTDLERSQERVSALLEDGAATTAQADSATAARDRAESSRAAAEAAVALAREDLRDTRLVAAYAGTVVARHAEPGQRVRPGEVVLSIEGGAPEIVVAIPESLS
ncbi:MAG: efflux RND transporter periplasmic adaptor subunit, partial [Myxococcota bacterium]